MAILSVDLAYKHYRDIGAVVLQEDQGNIQCELLPLPLTGSPTPDHLATFLHTFCTAREISILLLDGPQGWRADDSPLVHSRHCERALNTPAKTGLPGVVKPANYALFVTFSIAVFDALTTLKWKRLATIGGPLRGRVVMESFPLAVWRSLGIPPLSAKAKTKPGDIADRLVRLSGFVRLPLAADPTHDQLQAFVAGLAGVALERGDWNQCDIKGITPAWAGGCWREGYIVLPKGMRSGQT